MRKLVEKQEVIKVITSYLAEAIDDVETDKDALRILKYGLDLSLLIDDMEEVKDE